MGSSMSNLMSYTKNKVYKNKITPKNYLVEDSIKTNNPTTMEELVDEKLEQILGPSIYVPTVDILICNKICFF